MKKYIKNWIFGLFQEYFKQDLTFSRITDVELPKYSSDEASGIDFYTPKTFEKVELKPNESILIASGIHLNIPYGYELVGYNKSGIAAKRKLVLGACVIDSDYQGELLINIHNIGTEVQVIEPNMKIAQFLFRPRGWANLIEVDFGDLYKVKTKRGEGGFGSTN
jgi:dUTP pyrophosphatase